jgi:hypothetical protein
MWLLQTRYASIEFLAVTALVLGVLGIWRWPVADMLQGVGLLSAFVLAGLVGLAVMVRTRRLGSGWKPLCLCAGL